MVCDVMNKLQMQPFIINQKGLHFTLPFHSNPHILYDMLRSESLERGNTKSKFNLSSIVGILDTRIQRARYSQFLIRVAEVCVYEELILYLDAFIASFYIRGRIERMSKS